MSTFREKPHRKSNQQKILSEHEEQHTSIDAYHQHKLKQFEQHATMLEKCMHTESILMEQLQLIRDSLPLSIKRTTKEYEIECQLLEVRQTIQSLNEHPIQYDYWIRTTPLLRQYYRPDVIDKEKPKESITDVTQLLSEQTIDHLVKTSMNSERKNLFDRYLQLTHETACSREQAKRSDMSLCETCKVEKVPLQHEGMTVCPSCGSTEYALMHSDRPCFKEKQQQETLSSYTYKRINHFNEWLSEFQAKELTVVPVDVLNTIKMELKKHRLLDPEKLQYSDMRSILKKLKFNRYYEHIPYIMTKLTGKQAAIISKETEDLLRTMFKQLQPPFEKHCPEGRSNFLSYRYVLRKMFEMLHMHEYADQFLLPKSKHKIVEYDSIWSKCCEELKWPFYPTTFSGSSQATTFLVQK